MIGSRAPLPFRLVALLHVSASRRERCCNCAVASFAMTLTFLRESLRASSPPLPLPSSIATRHGDGRIETLSLVAETGPVGPGVRRVYDGF